MTRTAYLTIDDSPSLISQALVSYIGKLGIPAFYFCVGTRLEEHMAPMVQAVQQGGILCNHSFTHRPAGALDVATWIDETERTERAIDAVYAAAKRPRHGYYYRFPYCDRGDGDRIEQRFHDFISAVEAGKPVALPTNDKVEAIQAYLKSKGYVQPFAGVTHPLYEVPMVRDAADCLATYTSCDWMLTGRHLGHHPYLTTSDLIARMEADPWLMQGAGPQIVLLHDQPDIGPVTIGLINYMVSRDFTFLGV